MGELVILAGKKPTSFRLSEEAKRRVARASEILGKDATDTVDTAITHLLGTILRDEPLWVTLPNKPGQEPQSGAVGKTG